MSFPVWTLGGPSSLSVESDVSEHFGVFLMELMKFPFIPILCFSHEWVLDFVKCSLASISKLMFLFLGCGRGWSTLTDFKGQRTSHLECIPPGCGVEFVYTPSDLLH